MTRAQRDLTWVIKSAPLMVFDSPGIWPDSDWYSSLTIPDGENIPLPPDPHHFRLGAHFEELIDWWLDHNSDWRRIMRNLQVYAQSRTEVRTVGEFDFIVTNAELTEHWEVAVKFYLGVEDTSKPNNWFGANTEDRLDKKLERLRSHQLRLSEHPSAKSLLAGHGIQIQNTRCIIKGRLFYPYAACEQQSYSPPAGANASHESGWWLGRESFGDTMTTKSSRWFVLQKQHWLSTITADDDVPTLSLADLMNRLFEPASQQAVHVAELIDSVEISRGFVVNEKWVNRVEMSGA